MVNGDAINILLTVNKMNEENKLWEEFKNVPFPTDLAGEEINGVDPAEIDTYVAGCICSYIKGGVIDDKRIEILKKCLMDIQTIQPKLDKESKRYFSLLSSLGSAVIDKTKN